METVRAMPRGSACLVACYNALTAVELVCLNGRRGRNGVAQSMSICDCCGAKYRKVPQRVGAKLCGPCRGLALAELELIPGLLIQVSRGSDLIRLLGDQTKRIEVSDAGIRRAYGIRPSIG